MKRRPSFLNCCGGGCVSFIILFGIVFSIGYSITGRYKPVIPPPRPLPAMNGYNDYVRAAQTAQGTPGLKGMANPGPPNIRVLSNQLSANSSALAILRAGLGKDCVVSYNRDPNTLFPELAGFRDLARLILSEELVKSRHGDYAGAMQSGLDGMQFSQDIMRGGPLIHALVGIACRAIVERPMVDAIDHLSPQDCDRFVKRLIQMLPRQTTDADILLEERAFSLTNLIKITDAASAFSGNNSPGQWDRMFGGMAWHFMRDKTIRDISDYFDKGIEQARKPISKRVRVPEPTGVYSGVFALAFDSIYERFATLHVHSRLLLCALAIRSHLLKHGTLPNSLSSLGLPSEATTDPCTGQPFIYRPTGRDYLLYSVGPDGKDDGGLPANEVNSPIQGDMGIASFRKPATGTPGPGYRRVHHMKPPALPKGAPALPN